MTTPRRYAIVGTGGRSRMFIDAICGRYAPHARLVGFCDVSPTRMNVWNAHLADAYSLPPVPTFTADRFDDMVAQTRPDVVIVTTVDACHDQYLIRAMELGCDAVTEKPMTTDEHKARAVLDAARRTGRSVRVTFNYRYMSAFTRLREVVMQGLVGTPTRVDFQWYLDTSHGADYFRRWHREMDKSGGLLVHKSTHHFDLVNFILDDRPDTVFAMGDLMFYGRENATRRGESYPYQRYTGQPAARHDPFALFLDGSKKKLSGGDGTLQKLYLDAEHDNGYIRDRNVFGDDPPIDIYDTHAVLVRYRRGAILNYSMFAYCPWEGERLVISGTKGQVEYFSRGAGHIIAGQSDAELSHAQKAGEQWLRLQPMFQPARDLDIPPAEGGHGGGDPRLLERIFAPDPAPDPFHRDADQFDGAASILTGVAANYSIQRGTPIRIDDLLKLPDRQPVEA